MYKVYACKKSIQEKLKWVFVKSYHSLDEARTQLEKYSESYIQYPKSVLKKEENFRKSIGVKFFNECDREKLKMGEKL